MISVGRSLEARRFQTFDLLIHHPVRRAHIDSGQLKAILRPWAAALGVAAAIRLAVSWVLGN